jgi:Cysteine-rich secretory protein family
MATESHSHRPRIRKHTLLKIIVISGTVLPVLVYIVAVVAYNKELAAQKAAQQAEQARLAADLVTVSGLYNALNKERATVGASALASLTNLSTAAEQKCNDMVTSKYFDYKNPATGKESHSYITDNAGGLYIKEYGSSLFSAIPASQTAGDAVKAAISKQAEYLNNPVYNSVGWAVCQSPTNPAETYIVGMLANKQEKPAPAASAPARTYTPYIPKTTRCYTNYNTYGGYLNPTATSTCY